jgi:hypothetical protein
MKDVTPGGKVRRTPEPRDGLRASAMHCLAAPNPQILTSPFSEIKILLEFRPQWLKPEMVQWLQIFVTFVSS